MSASFQEVGSDDHATPHLLRPLYLAESISNYDGPSGRGAADLIDCFSSDADARLARMPQGTAFDDADQFTLLWFRWVVGHQVSFAVWQLLGVLSERQDERSRAASARLVDMYSLMLMYCGSCSRSDYENVIRPSLSRVHEAFSGTWARDYANVRRILRRSAMLPSGDRMRRAIRRNHLVHELIGQRLVESGKSLVREAAERTDAPTRLDARDEMALFDCAFFVVRTPTTLNELVGQLLSRLQAIRTDLSSDRWKSADINMCAGSDPRWREVSPSLAGIAESVASACAGLRQFQQSAQHPSLDVEEIVP